MSESLPAVASTSAFSSRKRGEWCSSTQNVTSHIGWIDVFGEPRRQVSPGVWKQPCHVTQNKLWCSTWLFVLIDCTEDDIHRKVLQMPQAACRRPSTTYSISKIWSIYANERGWAITSLTMVEKNLIKAMKWAEWAIGFSHSHLINFSAAVCRGTAESMYSLRTVQVQHARIIG